MAERDGTPHVVPVGRRLHPARDAIDVGAHDLELIRVHTDRVVSWGVANRSWQALPVPRRTGAR